MNNVVNINIYQFLLIYLLLVFLIVIFKIIKIDKTKILIISSLRMTIQLFITGLLLTYIFKANNLLLTFVYMLVIIFFTIFNIKNRTKITNKKILLIITSGVILAGFSVLIYFILVVLGKQAITSQYIIPIFGMLMGNTMTGISLALKTYINQLKNQTNTINVLTGIGINPQKILFPYSKEALETGIMPTITSMLGMGVVSLPGMMTGQILAGIIPTTAILYQIAIMIAITTVVCLANIFILYFISKSLYDKHTYLINLDCLMDGNRNE